MVVAAVLGYTHGPRQTIPGRSPPPQPPCRRSEVFVNLVLVAAVQGQHFSDTSSKMTFKRHKECFRICQPRSLSTFVTVTVFTIHILGKKI